MAKGEWKRSGTDDLQLTGRSDCEVFDDGTNTFFWWVKAMVMFMIVFISWLCYDVVCVCVCDVQRLFSSVTALLGFSLFCNLSRTTLDQLKALRWTDAADKTLYSEL